MKNEGLAESMRFAYDIVRRKKGDISIDDYQNENKIRCIHWTSVEAAKIHRGNEMGDLDPDN